ncbi:MAG: tetratricopeptide repeat protein [Ignavibacteriales bacterium]|nr:tetratricopeptide repeat protein [Ignavibacteriales bacterium]
MLKGQKKITKHEIKEDKLVTTYFEAQGWIENNKRLMSYIVGVPIALILLGWFYTEKRSDWNDTASAQLAKILPYYEQGRYQESINGVPQEGAQGLTMIVDEYGSTKSGEIARFYLANSYFNLGNYDKALENYKSVDLSDNLLSASVYAGIAACYENKGDHAEAASYYEKAAFKHMKPSLAPENLFNAAANYAAAGKKEKAVELLKTLKKEFPNSNLARDVDRYIASFAS